MTSLGIGKTGLNGCADIVFLRLAVLDQAQYGFFHKRECTGRSSLSRAFSG